MGGMKFSLRTLTFAMAVVPVVIGYIVTSIRPDDEGHVVVTWQDPILTLGILSWIGVWIHFVRGRTSEIRDEPQLNS